MEESRKEELMFLIRNKVPLIMCSEKTSDENTEDVYTLRDLHEAGVADFISTGVALLTDSKYVTTKFHEDVTLFINNNITLQINANVLANLIVDEHILKDIFDLIIG